MDNPYNIYPLNPHNSTQRRHLMSKLLLVWFGRQNLWKTSIVYLVVVEMMVIYIVLSHTETIVQAVYQSWPVEFFFMDIVTLSLFVYVLILIPLYQGFTFPRKNFGTDRIRVILACLHALSLAGVLLSGIEILRQNYLMYYTGNFEPTMLNVNSAIQIICLVMVLVSNAVFVTDAPEKIAYSLRI